MTPGSGVWRRGGKSAIASVDWSMKAIWSCIVFASKSPCSVECWGESTAHARLSSVRSFCALFDCLKYLFALAVIESLAAVAQKQFINGWKGRASALMLMWFFFHSRQPFQPSRAFLTEVKGRKKNDQKPQKNGKQLNCGPWGFHMRWKRHTFSLIFQMKALEWLCMCRVGWLTGMNGGRSRKRSGGGRRTDGRTEECNNKKASTWKAFRSRLRLFQQQAFSTDMINRSRHIIN